MPSREDKKGRFVRFCDESLLVLGIIRCLRKITNTAKTDVVGISNDDVRLQGIRWLMRSSVVFIFRVSF